MTIAAVPPLPVTPLNEEHQAWLMKRGIPIEIATEAGLRSRGRQLLFPYTLSGTEIYVKIRGPEKKFFVEPSGVPLVLWGLDSLRDVSSDTLIVTEGEADALAWMTAGAPAVVSVPNGAIRSPGEGDINPLDDKRFQYLWTTDGRLLPILEKFRRIILSTDGDEPGIVLGNELAVRLGAERCWRLDYPEGCKDANDVLVQHGIDGLDALLKGAKPVTRPKLGCFYEIPEDDGPVYPVGMKLGNHIKICPPELFVVTGAPSAGKSQFTLCLVADLARLHGLKGAILQLEDPGKRNRRDLEKYAAAWHRDGQLRGGDGPKIDCEPREWIKRMFKTLVCQYVAEEEPYTLEWLTTSIKEAVRMHGCKCASRSLE